MAVYTQRGPRMNGLLLHYTLALTKALDWQWAKPVMCGLHGRTGMKMDIKLQNNTFNTICQWAQPTGLCFHHCFFNFFYFFSNTSIFSPWPGKLSSFPWIHFHVMLKRFDHCCWNSAPSMSRFNSCGLLDFTKFLAYDLTLSESLTHTPLKLHTLQIWSFLNFPQSSYPSYGKKTISCVFPASGSNGHMNEPAVTKQAILGQECYEQVIVEGEDAV